jgi:nucleotide-binding universal stress UspA family protein
MFDRVLVPVDFSEHSAIAFGHAALIAQVFGGRLELVHVVEQVVSSHPSFWSAEPALADELHRQSIASAQTLLDDLLQARAAQLGPGAQGRILSGSVPGALADYAEDQKIGLIVTSTHGRTGFARWLMGSVSERLLRVAPCSVLVVRGASSVLPPVIGKVLVAVDLSEYSRRALEVAAALAAPLGASLQVLHVWAGPFQADAATSRGPLLERMRDTAQANFDAFVSATPLPPGLSVTRHLASGTPSAAINEQLASQHPDLLVLGTHGYGGVKRLVLGSVAEALARYAPCATLVVR